MSHSVLTGITIEHWTEREAAKVKLRPTTQISWPRGSNMADFGFLPSLPHCGIGNLVGTSLTRSLRDI